jgi:phenylacetate-CoA ligase
MRADILPDRAVRSLIEKTGLDGHGRLGQAVRTIGAHLPDRLTFGPRYTDTRRLVSVSDSWSVDDCRAWMKERLQELVSEGGIIDPDAPGWPSWLDLSPVGLLSRSDLAANPVAFRRASYRGPVRWVSTGGTTGRPVTFPMEPSASAAEWAYFHHLWSRFGYSPGDRRLVLRGIEPRNNRPVSYDPLAKELRVSPFHLAKPYWENIVDEVRRFRPRFVHGYPSAVARFSELWRGPLPRVQGVFLCSEDVSPQRWDRIEGSWNAPVVSWFGHSEKQVLGGNCPGNRAYHLFPTYGLAEVIGEGGEAVQGEHGRLVVTGFVSRAFRLIRYETGDAARFVGWGCQSCGLQGPLNDQVVGRWVHAPLIGRNGVPVTMVALNFHTQELSGARRLRYVQEEPGRVHLLVEADSLSPDAANSILNVHHHKFGAEIELTLQRVDEIPLMASGKHILVDQRLPQS